MSNWGTWDGWAGAVLSALAILVGIGLAWWALRSSKQLAKQQQDLERVLAERQELQIQQQTALDEESYLSSRMQELVQHARTTIAEAHSIHTVTSPRIYELLSVDHATQVQREERQHASLAALSRLQVEVDLLRIYAVTMPLAGSGDRTRSESLMRLMDEGAWLYSEALHCAIVAFDQNQQELDLSDNQEVVDALMNGAFANLNTRLLSDCIGFDPDSIPHYSEPGSPWPEVYRRRKQMLLDTVMARKSWVPRSLAEAASWSLAHTVDRFQDALMDVLEEWNANRQHSGKQADR